MQIKSRLLFVLIGNDLTGKTSLQKKLIERIQGAIYDRLPVNKLFEIQHSEIKRKYKNVSFGNRSYQEKIGDYISVENFFQNHFATADIAFISSHLVEADIRLMIEHGHRRFYNVYGVFFSNSIEVSNHENSQISLLNWDERLFIENPTSTDAETIERQLDLIADSIMYFLVNHLNNK